MSLSAFNLKQAFGREKPHSSVTDWIEIMTTSQTPEESYEGVFELVDAINLQASGPMEAARALRKKMKHGGPHQQYRAIVIMRSLLDNVPEKMKTAFSDAQFLDVIKMIFTDPYIDKRVQKRLSTILLAWQEQHKDDPSMAPFAGLYAQFKKDKHLFKDDDLMTYLGHPNEYQEPKKKVKEEKTKTRERKRRRSFNLERDKAKVTNSIVEASQASSNLINAIMRVNLDIDTFEANAEVQDRLTKAKNAKKVIMRYTQLVEDEELIGTLIETHERLEAALNTYTQLTASDDTAALASGVAQVTLTDHELGQIQADNDAAIARTKQFDITNGNQHESNKESNNPYRAFLHPDLADLDLNSDARNLPPPMRPTTFTEDSTSGRGIDEDKRGSLSDYSDYESSDEETHSGASAKRRNYVTVSDDSGDHLPVAAGPSTQPKQPVAPAPAKFETNPFADPFADRH